MRTGRPKQRLILAGRAGATAIAGPSGAQPAGPGSARACGAGLRPGTKPGRGKCGPRWAWSASGARAFCKLVGKDSTTSRDLGRPQGKPCRGRAGGNLDLGRHASRRDAVEPARFGQSYGAQPHDHQPHLAGVRVATSPYRYLQTIYRPPPC